MFCWIWFWLLRKKVCVYIYLKKLTMNASIFAHSHKFLDSFLWFCRGFLIQGCLYNLYFGKFEGYPLCITVTWYISGNCNK